MYERTKIPAWKNFRCTLDDKPEIYRRYGQYWGTSDFTAETLSRLLATYFGYITAVDDAIGRIMARGVQSNRVVSTLKHFAIYSDNRGARELYRPGRSAMQLARGRRDSSVGVRARHPRGAAARDHEFLQRFQRRAYPVEPLFFDHGAA